MQGLVKPALTGDQTNFQQGTAIMNAQVLHRNNISTNTHLVTTANFNIEEIGSF